LVEETTTLSASVVLWKRRGMISHSMKIITNIHEDYKENTNEKWERIRSKTGKRIWRLSMTRVMSVGMMSRVVICRHVPDLGGSFCDIWLVDAYVCK
jgi:hypothetical protein